MKTSTEISGSDTEREVFAAAAAVTLAERAAFLHAACAAQPEMRARVEEWLRALELGGFMAAEGAGEWPKPEEAGEEIGPYELRERIGEGGFGTVWIAEQRAPVRRLVALKIIKLGMDTREVVARFGQERQALAMMEHPHIARVFDAGATPLGRPFFAMELVRGKRITDYCDAAGLPLAERLRLFIAVCQAVQHAHQKGIIHRDLKPSNILVTLIDGVAVPKVIDFGVAKAIDRRLTDFPVQTGCEQMIGTPLYMSPEQAVPGEVDIDTRSDIYALGVLLYELLTGCTPLDPAVVTRASAAEMRRLILEVDPPWPSALWRGKEEAGPKSRRADDTPFCPAHPGRAFSADLDWITMKALEKDRARRYETAVGFARDIERHLASEPVLARPASRVYRWRRLFRRNRLTVAMTGALALALLAGATFSTSSFLREQDQRRQSEGYRQRVMNLLYDSDVNLAEDALRDGDLPRAQRFLDASRPAPGQRDLRGWEWRHLWQRCRENALAEESGRALPEHVELARLLPGGRLVLAQSTRYGMSVLDLETMSETPLLANPAACARFAPPKWLGLYDGARFEVHEITAHGLRRVGERTIGPGFSTYFAYSEESGLLAWSPGRGQVCVGRLGVAEKVDLLTDDEVDYPVRFSHDGRKLLVTQGVSGAVRVWDVATARRLPAAERYFSPYDFKLNSYNACADAR